MSNYTYFVPVMSLTYGRCVWPGSCPQVWFIGTPQAYPCHSWTWFPGYVVYHLRQER